MPSTFSQNLRLELIGSGEQSGVWGQTTNNNLGDLIEQAISGATVLDVTLADITLTALNGVVDQSRSAVLRITGTPGTTRTITIPNVSKTYTVKNRSDSTVNIKTASGSPFAIPTLSEAYIYCDANNVITGRIITDAAAAFTANSTPLNNLALTGVPTAPTAAFGTSTTQLATTAFVQAALQTLYPIGSVYINAASTTNPATLLGFGTWTAIGAGRVLVGQDTGDAIFDTLGETGGSKDAIVVAHTHTGTTASVSVAHTHSFTTGTESQSHSHAITVNAANTDHIHGFSATTGGAGGHNHTGSGTTSATNVDHIHSGTTGNNNVGHTHSFSASTDSQGLHSHGINDPGHTHLGVPLNVINTDRGTGTSFFSLDDDGVTQSSFTGITTVANGAHTHSVSGTTSGQSANHVHAFSTGGMSANTTHSHTYSFTTSSVGDHAHSVSGNTGAMSTNSSHTHSASSGNASQSHTHSGTTNGMSGNDPHAHSFTTNSTGSSGTNANLQPYLVVKMWQRTA